MPVGKLPTQASVVEGTFAVAGGAPGGVVHCASAAPGVSTTAPTTPPNPASAVVANMLVASSEARLRLNDRLMSDMSFLRDFLKAPKRHVSPGVPVTGP